MVELFRLRRLAGAIVASLRNLLLINCGSSDWQFLTSYNGS